MDDINFNLIKTDEDKKWLISRIDSYHQIMIDSMKTSQERYGAITTQASKHIKDIRNYVLTGFGMFITLFLGYSSLYPLEQGLFFIILIPSVIITLSLFIVFNWLNSIVLQFFTEQIVIIREQEANLLSSQGFIVSSVAFLSSVNPKFLVNYFNFTGLLTNAIFATLAKEYKKQAKKYSFLKDLSKSLKSESKEFEKGIQFVSENYAQLDKTQGIPPTLIKFVDEALKKYR